MRLGILICSYNRPLYLKQCLDSIKRADLSQVDTLMIIDDHSTDPETIRLINDFELEGVELIKAFSKENRSIKGSLLFGCDLLFNSCDVVTNLDGDAIVASNFIEVILELKQGFPDHIVTGFNCVTRNKDGSVRHKVLGYSDGYNWKASVGGLNMCFNKKNYDKWIRPSLVKCLKSGGNWDHQSCIASFNSGKCIICAAPSVVQHIGIDSSMGHSKGGEPPDVADDFFIEVWDSPNFQVEEMPVFDVETEKIKRAIAKQNGKLYLPDVTLIAVDDNIEGIIKAADISTKMIQFAAVKLLSCAPSKDPRSILIRHLGSKKEYSQFMLKEIVDYIDTTYFIVTQSDGFILDYTKWSDDFLKYDFCGAVWNFRDHNRVGNGGCSIRSRRLHEVLKNDETIVLKNDHIIVNWAEDHNIGYIYRDYLETAYKIKFAPEEVCNRFSFEGWGLKPPDNKYKGSFAFHGFSIDFNDADLPYIPYKLPNREIQ